MLGSDVAELARLDHQAAAIAQPTEMLLRAAGIAPGMRVLDLGTGLGHVALMLAELVGPKGSVVAIDQSPAAIEVAVERAAAAGAANVHFAEGDVTTWRDDLAFDAIVGRLVLFHMADPVAVVRHHLAGLKAAGLMVAVDYDIGASRVDPPTPLATRALSWVMAAFTHAGAHPSIGPHLAQIFSEAGVGHVRSFGIQGYLDPHDPTAARMLAGVVRSLHDTIIGAGIADAGGDRARHPGGAPHRGGPRGERRPPAADRRLRLGPAALTRRPRPLAFRGVSRAYSSAGERPLHTREVLGSIPSTPMVSNPPVSAVSSAVTIPRKVSRKVLRSPSRFSVERARWRAPGEVACKQNAERAADNVKTNAGRWLLMDGFGRTTATMDCGAPRLDSSQLQGQTSRPCSNSACRAVSPPIGRAAASTWLSRRGFGARTSAGTTACSAATPSRSEGVSAYTSSPLPTTTRESS